MFGFFAISEHALHRLKRPIANTLLIPHYQPLEKCFSFYCLFCLGDNILKSIIETEFPRKTPSYSRTNFLLQIFSAKPSPFSAPLRFDLAKDRERSFKDQGVSFKRRQKKLDRQQRILRLFKTWMMIQPHDEAATHSRGPLGTKVPACPLFLATLVPRR